VATELKKIEQTTGWTVIFKASFDKANRTSINSFRGIGVDEGLRLLKDIKTTFELPVLTDIHTPEQATLAAQHVDILQIPAFLCRQTDLLVAAGQTDSIVNIKKAQFLSANDMQHVLQKIVSTGNKQILLTERGTMFGYNNLVVDYTGIAEMMHYNYPIIMDATHSVQKPGGANGKRAGNRQYAPLLAQAAAAIRVKGCLIDTHHRPYQVLSVGTNMIFLKDLSTVLHNLNQISALNLYQIK